MMKTLARSALALAFRTPFALALALAFGPPALLFAGIALAQSAGAPDLHQAVSTVDLGAILSGLGPNAIVGLAIASFAASVFCALTPTPAPGSAWARLYHLVELVAVITPATKETGIPAVDALAQANRALHLIAGAAPAPKPTDPVSGGPKLVGAIALCLGLGVALSGCTTQEAALAQTDACWIQAAANASTAIATAAGNAKVAVAGSALSVAAGVECATPLPPLAPAPAAAK
jgi:hypothetical protein